MRSLLAASVLFFYALLASRTGDAAQGANVSGGHDSELDRFMNLFKNPDVVKEFKKYLDRGLLEKDRVFTMSDPNIREQTMSAIKFFYNLNTERGRKVNEFFRWMTTKMNLEQLAYALSIGSVQNTNVVDKNFNRLFNWYEITPNYFLPKAVLEEVKAAIEQGTYDPEKAPLIVPDVNDRTAYFREDPVLNSMFYNWHIMFPTWLDPKDYNDRWGFGLGDFFYEFHNQLVTSYYLITASNEGPITSLRWDSPIKDGYNTRLSNTEGKPLASRAPGRPWDISAEFRELMDIHEKIAGIWLNRTFHYNDSFIGKIPESDESFAALLGDTVYNTTGSVNPSYYKSYYDAAVKYLASIGSDPATDGGGYARYPQTALRDPAFYGLLTNVNAVIRFYRTRVLPPHEKKNLINRNIKFDWFGVDPLETFYEPFNISLKLFLNRTHEFEKDYSVKQLRLNHKPFKMRFNVTSKNQRNESVLISVFLAHRNWPAVYRNDVDLHLPIDSFKITVKPGGNEIIVNFNESLIYASGEYEMVQCGLPKNLALPKGRDGGLKMKMIAVMTPYVGDQPDDPDEADYGVNYRSPLCANPYHNHGRPFGFPFDRRPDVTDPDMEMIAIDVKIYHAKRTFSDTVTV